MTDEDYWNLPQSLIDKRNEFYTVHRKIRNLKKRKIKLNEELVKIREEIRTNGKLFTKLYNELESLDSKNNPKIYVIHQKRPKVTTKRTVGRTKHNKVRKVVEGQFNYSFFVKIKFGGKVKTFHLSTEKNTIEILSKYCNVKGKRKMDNIIYELQQCLIPIILHLVDFKDLDWFNKFNLKFKDCIEELERRSNSYNIFN